MMRERSGEMTSAEAFRIVVGMPSGPLAFLGSSFLSRAQTPGWEMVIFGIGGNGDGSMTEGYLVLH